MTTDNQNELIEKYKELEKEFIKMQNDCTNLYHCVISVLGTYKFFAETANFNIPLPYKIVEDLDVLEKARTMNREQK
jgi:hypothetical protein